MNAPMMPIAAITPDIKMWTAKVLVVHRYVARQARSSPCKYQRFLFIDKEGTMIQAVLYGVDPDSSDDKLKEQCTYEILNAKVSLADAKFNFTDNKYQWILNRSTIVEEILDDPLPRNLGAPAFTALVNLPNVQRAGNYYNVIGVVVEKIGLKNITSAYGPATIYEVVIVDESAIPVMLTLWNDIVSTEGQSIIASTDRMPIVAATRLSVTNYNGVSLAAKGFSHIMVDPSYPEAQRLRAWRGQNYGLLTDLATKREYMKQPESSPSPKEDRPRSTVAEAIMNEGVFVFSVHVGIRLAMGMKKVGYVGCAKCCKGCSAPAGFAYRCNYCRTQTVATARLRLIVTIADDTQLDAVVFGPIGEKLLGRGAAELIEEHEKYGILDYEAINGALEGRKFVVEIKRTEHEGVCGTERQYCVNSIVEDPVVEHGIADASCVAASSSSSAGLKGVKKRLFKDVGSDEDDGVGKDVLDRESIAKGE